MPILCDTSQPPLGVFSWVACQGHTPPYRQWPLLPCGPFLLSSPWAPWTCLSWFFSFSWLCQSTPSPKGEKLRKRTMMCRKQGRKKPSKEEHVDQNSTASNGLCVGSTWSRRGSLRMKLVPRCSASAFPLTQLGLCQRRKEEENHFLIVPFFDAKSWSTELDQREAIFNFDRLLLLQILFSLNQSQL